MEYIVEQQDLKIKISSLPEMDVQAFFDMYIPSKKLQHQIIQNKWISIDGQWCKRETLLSGKYLELRIYPNVHPYYHSSHRRLDVVYEDELVLVVNKPSGMIVHSDGTDKECLEDLVKTYFHDEHKLYYEAQAIHRLDEKTSGLVVFSKSPIFQAMLDQMLEKKQIRRSYLAFVKGKISANTRFQVEKAIGKDRHNSKKMICNPKGLKAITKFTSLGYSNKNYSVLSCRLLTGRTHQIRLHLSSEGYPILNDDLYGVKSDLLKDMGLVANELVFFHPLKGEMLTIELELKGDFKRLLENIE